MILYVTKNLISKDIFNCTATFQGWTIAASSEFIPHMVFKYFESSTMNPDDTTSMKGYVGWSLSGKI